MRGTALAAITCESRARRPGRRASCPRAARLQRRGGGTRASPLSRGSRSPCRAPRPLPYTMPPWHDEKVATQTAASRRLSSTRGVSAESAQARCKDSKPSTAAAMTPQRRHANSPTQSRGHVPTSSALPGLSTAASPCVWRICGRAQPEPMPPRFDLSAAPRALVRANPIDRHRLGDNRTVQDRAEGRTSIRLGHRRNNSRRRHEIWRREARDIVALPAQTAPLGGEARKVQPPHRPCHGTPPPMPHRTSVQ